MYRRTLGLGFILALSLVALAVAGCGQAANANGPGGSTSAPSVHIGTHTATVGGQSETVLTNDAGMTLYYFDADSATASACSGACLQNWPPLLTSGIPSFDTSLKGTVSYLDDAAGRQATYNGHPLYTYAGDHAAGDTTGDGVKGQWHVATPDIKDISSSSGGYSY